MEQVLINLVVNARDAMQGPGTLTVQTKNIEVRTGHSVVGLEGDQALEAVTLRDGADGAETTEDCRALFIFIGAVPRTDWLGGQVETDEKGFLLTDVQLTQSREMPTAFQALGRPPTDVRPDRMGQR